jgi:hypothetical protein
MSFLATPEKSVRRSDISSGVASASSLARFSDVQSGEAQDAPTLHVITLMRATPGIAVLTELLNIDPMSLPRTARIDYLSALERQTSWLQAAMQRAIVAVAGDEPSQAENLWTGIDESEREDVASALRLSGSTAQIRIDVARTLVNYLPNVCSALSAGDISPAVATVIARETASAIRDGLSPLAIFSIEQKALSFAEFHTPSQVASNVRTALAKIAPEEFESAVTTATDARRVSCYRESDGMSTIVAILPAVDAQLVMAAIEALVIASPDDAPENARSIDMKRADALTQLATQVLEQSKDEVRPHRRPITVNVTVDLPTLLGLAENPGQLAGYGAIPASLARSLASDAQWKRFITDPTTGALMDFGRESYEPPQALVDFLLARDRTCRFPGCRAPARLADLDHAQSWEDGGSTSAQNLGALCRRHHRLKTHGGWKLASESDGSCTWTSPEGKEYFVPARDALGAV